MLRDHLPHVGTWRCLERADVSPPEVHAVISNVAAAVEIVSDDTADSAPHGQFCFQGGVSDGRYVLIYIQIVLNYLFLTRRVALWDLHRFERMSHRVGYLPRSLCGVLKAEHLIHDIYVRQQVRNRSRVRFPFDVIKHQDWAAIQMLLNTGNLQIWIHLDVGLE